MLNIIALKHFKSLSHEGFKTALLVNRNFCVVFLLQERKKS